MKYQIYKALNVEPLNWVAEPCWYEDGLRAMTEAAKTVERGFAVSVMLIPEHEHAIQVDLGIEDAQGREIKS